MKSTFAASITLAALPLASATFDLGSLTGLTGLPMLGGLPACATTCITKTLTSTKCGIMDFKCLCSSDNFLSTALNCIDDTCAKNDKAVDTVNKIAQDAMKIAQSLCKSVGVNLALPSVTLGVGVNGNINAGLNGQASGNADAGYSANHGGNGDGNGNGNNNGKANANGDADAGADANADANASAALTLTASADGSAITASSDSGDSAGLELVTSTATTAMDGSAATAAVSINVVDNGNDVESVTSTTDSAYATATLPATVVAFGGDAGSADGAQLTTIVSTSCTTFTTVATIATPQGNANNASPTLDLPAVTIVPWGNYTWGNGTSTSSIVQFTGAAVPLRGAGMAGVAAAAVAGALAGLL